MHFSHPTPPFAIQKEIDDLAAVIEAAGGEASVYGMSSGAVLALEAANRGLTIERLALYEPPFVVDGSGPAVPPDYQETLAGLVAAGRRADAAEYFMTGFGTPPEVVAGMRTQPFWPAFEAVATPSSTTLR